MTFQRKYINYIEIFIDCLKILFQFYKKFHISTNIPYPVKVNNYNYYY